MESGKARAPSEAEIREAFARTNRLLRRLVGQLKDGQPVDPPAQEKLADSVKRAQRQIRRNKVLIPADAEQESQDHAGG